MSHYEPYILGPTRVISWDPCLFGSPEALGIVQIRIEACLRSAWAAVAV